MCQSLLDCVTTRCSSSLDPKKGQEEARTTKEDVEDASGEGEHECWFGEGGCPESNEMENGS